jgi:hypothetical protein
MTTIDILSNQSRAFNMVIPVQLAKYREGISRTSAVRAKTEAGDCCTRMATQKVVEQKRRDQQPVHNEKGSPSSLAANARSS